MSLRLAFSLVLATLAAPAFGADDTPFAGVYDGGQIEIAATMQLNPDGRFDYYLAYGALDEEAHGTWTVENGSLVLEGDPVSEPEFVLLDSKPGRGAKLRVDLDTPDYLPVELFAALVVLPDGTGDPHDFEKRSLSIPIDRKKPPDAIFVALPMFEVASERIALQAQTRSLHFRFDPNDLGRVAFDHEVLPREDDAWVLERHGRRLRFRLVTEEEVLPEDDRPADDPDIIPPDEP